MGRKYKQFRFYGTSNKMNEPKEFNGNNLNETNTFTELPVEIEVNGYSITINEDGSVE